MGGMEEAEGLVQPAKGRAVEWGDGRLRLLFKLMCGVGSPDQALTAKRRQNGHNGGVRQTRTMQRTAVWIECWYNVQCGHICTKEWSEW